jgi:NitT/TauT family transport system permease protein
MSSRTRVLGWRLVALAVIGACWEVLAYSGWFFQEAIPPLTRIGAALVQLLLDTQLWSNLAVTANELLAATLIGIVLGTAVGLILGSNRLLRQAYEPYLHYIAPTPKIIFFPVMLMWFGVGPGSKIAMGAFACFFPVALSVATGLATLNPVLIRVGRSFSTPPWHMTTKIYLPALRLPLLNGVRLGIGTALISVLLAETKLSDRGVGFLLFQSYTHFDIPQMYALLLLVFSIAVLINMIAARVARSRADPGV